jgi:hypothetical protein
MSVQTQNQATLQPTPQSHQRETHNSTKKQQASSQNLSQSLSLSDLLTPAAPKSSLPHGINSEAPKSNMSHAPTHRDICTNLIPNHHSATTQERDVHVPEAPKSTDSSPQRIARGSFVASRPPSETQTPTQSPPNSRNLGQTGRAVTTQQISVNLHKANTMTNSPGKLSPAISKLLGLENVPKSDENIDSDQRGGSSSGVGLRNHNGQNSDAKGGKKIMDKEANVQIRSAPSAAAFKSGGKVTDVAALLARRRNAQDEAEMNDEGLYF